MNADILWWVFHSNEFEEKGLYNFLVYVYEEKNEHRLQNCIKSRPQVIPVFFTVVSVELLSLLTIRF